MPAWALFTGRELIFIWKNGTEPHVNNFELGQFGP
jgi:hypothetical protein